VPVTYFISNELESWVITCKSPLGGHQAVTFSPLALSSPSYHWALVRPLPLNGSTTSHAPSYPNNPITGEPFTTEESVYLRQDKDRIGERYLKAVYREYADASFASLKPHELAEEHLGILGPIIHAEVGDTITVVFRNNTRFPVGIHPHGVFYDKSSEGAHYSIGAATSNETDPDVMPETGADIASGGEYTYHREVPERAGPGPADPDSIAWLYQAHDHEGIDIYAGLVGAIIVTRSGRANADGTPKDVDREFVTLFMIFDENMSPYLDANIQQFAASPKSINKTNDEFKEATRSIPLTDCCLVTSTVS